MIDNNPTGYMEQDLNKTNIRYHIFVEKKETKQKQNITIILLPIITQSEYTIL